jgi:PII-like signaling protein
MADDILVARLYLSERDHGKRRSLLKELLDILRNELGLPGCVVFRGIAGFGPGGEVHAEDMLRLSVDLPEVIEFFADPPTVAAAIARVKPLLPPGHIIHWPATRAGT